MSRSLFVTATQWLLPLLLWALAPPVSAATPVQGSEARHYYVEMANKASGPFDLEQVKMRLKEGDIDAHTLVWYPGQKGWVALKEVPELAALLHPPEPEPSQAEMPPPLPSAQPKPPAPPKPAQKMQYYVALAGKREGPIDEREVIVGIREGRLKSETLVWHKGMQTWKPLSSLPEFTKALAATETEQAAKGTGLPTTEAGLRQFMLGTWREKEADTEDYQDIVEIQFKADGTARFHEIEKAAGQAPMETLLTGYWKVTPIDDKRFHIWFGDHPPGQGTADSETLEGDLIYVDHDHLRTADDGTPVMRIR